MDGVDPDTLLEWLQAGCGDERDLQLMALEQLCMLLLMSDNIDRCFEMCPPRTFIPALCRIFLDETATDNVLEPTSRAITYYLDVSNECTRRITQVEGAVKAICSRLYVAEMTDRTQKDLAEQCVKLLEHVCQRETTAVYEAGGLHSMLFLVRQHGHLVHKDTLYSAMSVVQRLCSRVEPQNPNIKECTIDLGELLVHEDARVAESALRCFAALTDRYIRKLMNPAELAEASNLIEHLLDSLIGAQDVSLNESGMSAVYGTKSASFISIVLSLLSNLCRGSSQVTLTIVSSPKLIPALRAALSNRDERCVLDSLRLADLLVILLCEGRHAFSRSNVVASLGTNGDEPSSTRLSYDRTHRYLIDIIRQRDTGALIDAVESGTVDPNFTDDVGQTLLNWCSAFGTIEMVNFLCEKGADVNCGQRSSSLHYAACFGRVDVIIALLQNGANPDLRDEDGRTALEKARERSDESHQQVVQILESPSDYMMLAKKKRTEHADQPIELMETCTKKLEEEDLQQIEPSIVKDVIQQLIPIFCSVFNDSLVVSVRRATLSLIKKCIQYCPTDAFEDLVSGKMQLQDGGDDENSQQFVERLMRVVVAIFNDESNLEGHMQVIMILKSLFEKNAQFWLEQLIRLGIIEKVEQLASSKNVPSETSSTISAVATKIDPAETSSTDIFSHEPMDVSPDPLSTTSSILRSATSTPSIGLVSSESLRSQTSGGTTPETQSYGDRIRMLNVPVQLDEEMISDTETPPPTNEQHESNQQVVTTHMDTSESRGGSTSRKPAVPIVPQKRLTDDADSKRQKVYELAKDLWNTYLKDSHNKPREVFIQLRQAAQDLKEQVEQCTKNPEDFSTEEKLTKKLIRVRDLIANERLLSTFELASSGLIPALLSLVREACTARQGVVFQTFYKVFDDEAALSSMVKRTVQVLEHVEKFNQCLYDSVGGSAFGLQLLTRRLRFTMQQHNPRNEHQSQLLNRTGRVLKTEPLTTVGQLRAFLHRMVAKMWFDFSRESIFFVKELKSAAEKQRTIRLEYESDFDTNGLIWFLGTNAHTTAEWTNPAAIGLVQVWSSDGVRLPYGNVEDILSRDVNPMNCHTSDQKDAHFTLDLGVYLYPSAYTLRHARGYGKSALRTWDFEGSEDGKTWAVLKRHQADRSLQESGSTATFFLNDSAREKKVRFVRIQQRGYNASEMTHYLSLSGFEIYGEVVDVVVDTLSVPISETKSTGSSSRALRLQQQMFPPRPSGESRPGKESKSKKSSSSSSSKTGAIRLRKSGASSTVVPIAPSLSGNSSQLPLNLNNFVKFFESTSPSALDETPTNSPSSFVSAFGPGAYVTRQRLRPARPATQSFSSMNPATAVPPSTAVVAPSNSSSANANQLQQKSMSTTNLQDAEGQNTNEKPSVAATQQASSAETLGQLRKQSPSLENLLSRARLFVGTGSGLSQDRIQEAIPENDALTTDYESSLDAHSNNDLDSTQTLDDNNEQNIPSRHLSASTPEESEHFVVDGTGSVTNSQQQLYGFADAYQEILRSGNISAIEDVEFERAILSNCMPGGLLDCLVADEIADDDEMDSYSSDVPIPIHHLTSTTVPSSSNTTSSAVNSNLLAFIDEPVTASLATATTTTQTGAQDQASTRTSASSHSRLPLRHEIVQLLAEAAERHSSGSASPANVEIPTSTHSATMLPHDLVMSMLDVAGIRASLAGTSSEALSAAIHHQNRSNTGGRNQRKPTRNWDDEYVLRRQYNSLLPAFDPRPGRNNVNQTQDVELPPASNNEKLEPRRKKSHTPTTNKNVIFSVNNLPLNLYLCGPNVPGTPNVTVPLSDDDETVFAAVQRVFNSSEWATKPDKCRKVWEFTYEIIYEYPPSADSSQSDEVQCTPILADDNLLDTKNLNVKQTLDVLKHLHELADNHASAIAFVSPKLTQKLLQELGDSLVVAANAFPSWCETLVYNYPCLFSLETRNMFMRATAFGTSRAIVWLQNRRDQILDEARGSGSSQSSTAGVRREDHYPEFRIGRIKHERIRVERSDQSLWDQALRVLKYHSGRKSVLEIEFSDEEGTGLGPTLEFYALVAAEFQRKALGMWLCDDEDGEQQKLESNSLDLGEGVKPPGYYIRRTNGLFPAPAPPNSEEAYRMSDLFRVLGIFLAKALQDGRLVDLPLSLPFLRLLISDSVAGHNDFDLCDLSLDGLLGIGDLDEIHQHKARFLRAVQRVCIEKSRIRADSQLTASEKSKQIAALTIRFNDNNQPDAGHECKVEDLALTFVVNPPSKVFNYKEHELIPGGDQVYVTNENIELYLAKCVDFYLNSGIRQQIMAFREGFDSVFPLRSLKSFTAIEVQTLLSGEQCPEWTRDDLLQFIEPKLGYTRDSPGFLYFVDVVAAMSGLERKAFLQFTTGCSSLPPGGLANLHPRLTVVRKVDAGGNGSYPSVNTCVHYLKLPDYSSAEILRERLLAATHEKGFHLN